MQFSAGASIVLFGDDDKIACSINNHKTKDAIEATGFSNEVDGLRLTGTNSPPSEKSNVGQTWDAGGGLVGGQSWLTGVVRLGERSVR